MLLVAEDVSCQFRELCAQRPQPGRGETALIMAAKGGHAEVAQLLLQAGAGKAQGCMWPKPQNRGRKLVKSRWKTSSSFCNLSEIQMCKSQKNKRIDAFGRKRIVCGHGTKQQC